MTARRLARVALLTLLAACMLAPAAYAAPPDPSFTYDPAFPLPMQDTSFSLTNPVGADTIVWDFPRGEPAGATTAVATTRFAAPGPQTVTVTVSNAEGSATSSQTVIVNQKPQADFNFSPASPAPGDAVLFASTSSDPDGDPLSYQWDFGGSTQAGPVASQIFDSPGPKQVVLIVKDSKGATDTKRRTVVVRDPSSPTVSFTSQPAVPLVGAATTFTATATASSGNRIDRIAWDLDEDGQFDDATGRTATKAFPVAGPHWVRVRATQGPNGQSAVAERQIRVNDLPRAGFIWSPNSPFVGEDLQLMSASADAEGPLVEQDWDLDGDGSYDDGTGPSATTRFGSAGPHQVGLFVTDSDGAFATAEHTIVARAQPNRRKAKAAFMRPFPLVRIAGQVVGSRTLIEVFSVKGPRGSLIKVGCKGKGCPARSVHKRIKKRTVHFKAFERSLPAGVRLEVFVRKAKLVGKYTRFVIRNAKRPVRIDRCLVPGKSKPTRCPS